MSDYELNGNFERLLHLVVFTETEVCPFMDRELPYLKEAFKLITIFPVRKLDSDTSTIRKHLDDSVSINGTYAIFINNFGTKLFFSFNAFMRPSTYREIWRCRRNAALIPSIRRVLIDSAFFLATDYWLRNRLDVEKNEQLDLMFYGFWFAPYTYALAKYAKKDGATCISRAHGYDIYLDRTEVCFFPRREEAIKTIDHVFVSSEAGANYLQNLWPNYQSKFSCSYLGVDDPQVRNPKKSNNRIHVVSCSNVVDVKRVPLIAEVMILLSQIDPNVSLNWTHIGDGPELNQVIEVIEGVSEHSLNWELVGRKSRQEIEAIYSKEPIDVFINLSTTEGGAPVSIMEAMSFGIPVLATEVGGNPEIVDTNTGVLVPIDANSLYIAKQLHLLLTDELALTSKRECSYQKWKVKFDSETNYRSFTNHAIAEYHLNIT